VENARETISFAAAPEPRPTCGETLENGLILDLVQTPGRDKLDLLSWDGKEIRIRPVIDSGGISYRPPDLHPSVRAAVRFPTGVSAYGTTLELFRNVASVCRQLLRLPKDLAAFGTCWILSTWVPELILVPFTLCISAPFLQVCVVLRFFSALCRRALLTAELSRKLPLHVAPTLIVNDPLLEEETCDVWRAASCRGVFVAGERSTVFSIRCPKAVVLQADKAPGLWGPEAMHLILPHAELPPLDDRRLAEVAAEFQPQLEMFRLRVLSGAEPFLVKSHPLGRFELVRHLGACIPEAPEIVGMLTPLVESHQEMLAGWGSRDPQVASLRAVWDPLHKKKEKEMSVGDITNSVNAILQAFGETYEYGTRDIGWRLRNLKLPTRSNGQRKVLRFSAEMRSRIHQRVREFGLQLPFFEGCPECKGLQGAEEKPVE
jgi:hypothetical protein